MKKLLIFATFLFFFSNVKSQSYTYSPFPDSLGQWVSQCYDQWNMFSHIGGDQFSLANDTMSDGQFSYYEKGKIIYMKTASDSVYRILFDFNLTVGDTFYNSFHNDQDLGGWGATAVVMSDDSISTSFDWPGRRHLVFNQGLTWVEGVGNVTSWFGWYHNMSFGTLSGGCLVRCVFSDTAAYPCSNFSQAENALQRISIFPNPSNGHVFISNISQPTELNIYNSLGMLIQKTEVHNESEIDLSKCPKGLYLFTLKRDGALHTKRIILN